MGLNWYYCPKCDPPARTTKYDATTLEPVFHGRRTGTKVRPFSKGSPQRIWKPRVARTGPTNLDDGDDINWVYSYADWWYDPKMRHLVETGLMIDPNAITEPVADDPERVATTIVALAITCPNGHLTNLFRDHQRVTTAAIERLGDKFLDIGNRTGQDIDLIELELDDQWTARRDELREILNGFTEAQKAAASPLWDGCSVYDLDVCRRAAEYRLRRAQSQLAEAEKKVMRLRAERASYGDDVYGRADRPGRELDAWAAEVDSLTGELAALLSAANEASHLPDRPT